MSILFFLIGVLVLTLSGWLAAGLLLGKQESALRLSLALPIGSLINVILTAIYTFARIPLNMATLWGGLAVMCGIFFIFSKKNVIPSHAYRQAGGDEGSFVRAQDRLQIENGSSEFILSGAEGLTMTRKWKFLLRIFCGLLLISNFLYAFSHAVLLPSFQIDSFTNWTMRSQVSFADQAIAFDRTEARGVAKPQYPFLFHSLQITVNQGQARWNDTAANAVTLLLMLSSFAAMFLLLKRLAGADPALLTVTLILGIPLVALHLAQGYADIHLLGFGLLSFLSLTLGLREQSPRWFLLSAFMAAAAAWTKTEGLTLVFLPWVLILAWQWWRKRTRRKSHAMVAVVGIGIAALFYVLLLIKGLPLTPHESDAGFVWRPDAWWLTTTSLFTNGSFGITWYALLFFVALIVWMIFKKNSCVDPLMLPLLLWGLFAFAQTMFIYTFTPNVEFLLNAQSFYRQMFLPAAMLICSCSLMLRNPLKVREAVHEQDLQEK